MASTYNSQFSVKEIDDATNRSQYNYFYPTVIEIFDFKHRIFDFIYKNIPLEINLFNFIGFDEIFDIYQNNGVFVLRYNDFTIEDTSSEVVDKYLKIIPSKIDSNNTEQVTKFYFTINYDSIDFDFQLIIDFLKDEYIIKLNNENRLIIPAIRLHSQYILNYENSSNKSDNFLNYISTSTNYNFIKDLLTTLLNVNSIGHTFNGLKFDNIIPNYQKLHEIIFVDKNNDKFFQQGYKGVSYLKLNILGNYATDAAKEKYINCYSMINSYLCFFSVQEYDDNGVLNIFTIRRN